MKRIRVLALFTVLAVAPTTALVAQQAAVTATIPFNFTVGDHSLPAGDYTLSSPGRNIVQIQSADRKHAEFVASSQSSHEPPATPALVFAKYGGYYFLNRILCRTNTALNLDLPAGNEEKHMRTREAAVKTEVQIQVAAR
jgi:hypothetical protein